MGTRSGPPVDSIMAEGELLWSLGFNTSCYDVPGTATVRRRKQTKLPSGERPVPKDDKASTPVTKLTLAFSSQPDLRGAASRATEDSHSTGSQMPVLSGA